MNTPAPTPPPEGPAGGPPRTPGVILLVDDEAAVRRITGLMLKQIGYNVLPAADGNQALELFKLHADEIIAVILDLIMPGCDGVEVFNQISQLRPNTPVLMASGAPQENTAHRFGEKRPAGYLQKPFSFAALTAKLGECLNPPPASRDGA